MKRAAFITLALLLLATASFALPEYAVRYNQTCALCHYNPTGGGMRTLYGAQFFSYTDLPGNASTFEELQEMLPKAGDRLQYGFDFRTLYAATQRPDYIDSQGDDVTQDGFQSSELIQMQADAYLAYALTDATSAVIDISNNGVEEAFAMFTKKGGKLQFRAGRFRSTYGWGFVDHTVYVRRFLGYGSTQGPGILAYGTGAEAGFYNDRWDATAGISNGTPGTEGNDVYARGARRFLFGDIAATVGASGRWFEVGAGGNLLWQNGAFYGVSLGNFSFIGETDQYLYEWGSDDKTAIVSSHLLRYAIKPGWYANAWYDYHDPDLDMATGYDQRVRIGLDYIPRGYMSISPMIEYNQENLDTAGEISYGQFTLQLHLWL